MIRAGVYRNGELAGILTKEDDNTFSFEYDTSYLNKQDARNISVNFPLQKEAFRSEHIFQQLKIFTREYS